MGEAIKSGNKRNGKKTWFLLIFLTIILVAAYFGYSYYSQSIAQNKLKNEFFSNIQNNDFNFFLENNLYKNIANKMESRVYDSSSNIKLSTTMENNIFSKLDLSKFQINYNCTQNNMEKQSSHQVRTDYAGNHLLTVDFINNPEKLAIKSDEIVNRYVGIDKKNLQNVADKLANSKVNLSEVSTLKQFLIDRENIKLDEITQSSSINQYTKIFAENVASTDVSKKENVVIELDSKQVSTTEYTLTLDARQVKNILNKVSEKIESDDELISKLVVNDDGALEEENEILDYSDNENVSKVPGEQNNFNVTIQILDENTTAAENTTNTTQNTTVNAVITNTVNQVTNETTNETVNQVTNQTTEQTNTTTENTVINSVNNNEVEQNQTQENNEIVNQVTDNVVDNIPVPEPIQPPIEEDENLRMQGFISVNENDSSVSENSEFFVGENYEDTIKNISKFAEKIEWPYYLLIGAKVDLTEEELIAQIQKILSDKVKQNNSLIVKLYIYEGKMIKIKFEIPETNENFGVEIISKSQNEKYLNVTKLIEKNDEANGYTLSLYKKESDANTKIKLNINKITKNKINEKTAINLETKGTVNSKKYNTSMNALYSNDDGEFGVDIENLLNFESSAQVQQLNNENCLFIDEISDEELVLTWEAIKQKTLTVLNEKNQSLNIIDINNSNSIVKQNEQISNVEENSEGKEDAKQALIQTIANKMREYQDNGSRLKIENLDGLEIPGYEVNISISSNLAIITVNGYRFNLDSDFNLSDY